MVTLSSCLIWQIMSFILAPNEYGCVYAWTTLGNIATLHCRFWQKKIIFSDEAHFDLGGYVNKQNCRILGTENDALKTSHCLVWILVQRHNSAIVLRKWAKRGRYSPWGSLSGHVEWILVKINQKLKRRILTTFGFNRTVLRATQSMFCSLVLKSLMSHRADVVCFTIQYSWSHWWNTAAHNR